MARPSLGVLVVVALLVIVVLPATCSEPSGPGAPVATIQITPSASPVQITKTLQLAATPRDSNGVLLKRRVDWASGDTAIATVSANGLVTGVSLGSVSVTAISEGVIGIAAISVIPGPATQLVFTSEPSGGTAGVAIAPAAVVTARDVKGNTATGFTGIVTMAIATNPGGGTLSGTTSVPAVAGIATFDDLHINRSGVGYTLQAASGSLSAATSAAIEVVAGAAVGLAFTGQPSSAVAGSAIAPALQVTARDSLGNTATSFTGAVTLALTTGSGTAGATLSGTLTRDAVAGVAGFPGLSIDKSGNGYTVTATATGPGGATSAAFDVSAGAATDLLFTEQPSSTIAGSPIAPALQVTARDSFGNTATGFNGAVTLTITPGTGTSGAVLSGTTTQPALGGVATFADVSVDKSGHDYTLTTSAAGVRGATSESFGIGAGAAAHLLFTVQPGPVTAGDAITPGIQVTAQDALGNTADAFGGLVTVAITNNPAAGTLSGTTSVAAVAGIATFTDLWIDKAGQGYRLSASAQGGGPASATSGGFAVVPGVAVALAFTGPPAPATAGAAVSPGIEVTARDSLGNTASSFAGSVTVSITPGTGAPGATLSGTTTQVAAAGIATFTDLSIDKSGSGFTVTASAPGLIGATSPGFSVSPGTAAALVFTREPSTTTAGSAIDPAIQVTARDALGNTATGFSGDITVTLATSPGGGTLSGASSVTAVAGVATFATLSIDRSGSGYSMTATAPGLTEATSAAFAITAGSASQLVFTVEPGVTTAGETFAPGLHVTARDALGNTADAFQGTVTVAIADNPAGGTLSGTNSVAANAGVAVFTDLWIDKAGMGYTLSASAEAGGPAGVTSAGFEVVPATAAALVFSVEPTTTTAGAGITPALTVTARDAYGNTATGFTGAITMAIATNGGSGTLSGSLTLPATGGVATFADLSIDKAGAGYTLSAAAPGLTQATSATFSITAGTATRLVFTVQPSQTIAGQAIAPEVAVTALDAFGNTADGFAGTVSVTIADNPVGGTLAGTRSVVASAGVARFGDLWIDKAGSGYTLSATAVMGGGGGGGGGGSTGATSAGFDVTPGAAVELVFTVQPSSSTAGASIDPALQVTARDVLGNSATGFTRSVTMSITNPGGATLSGTRTVTAVAGVATFVGLSIDRSGTGYTLTATASGVSAGTSAAFAVAAGAATQLVFTGQPTRDTAGMAISPQVQVTARDAQGNTADGFAGTVSVAIANNPAGGILTGTTDAVATAGVAVFADLRIDKAGPGYTLSASAAGFGAATSAGFDVVPGAAVELVFTVEPSNTTAGAAIAPSPRVTARDALGNTATGFTGNVIVAIAANPGGDSLTGTSVVAAQAGVARFSSVILDAAGSGYTLSASAPGLGTATSSAFDVLPGQATRLVFMAQPASATAGTPLTGIQVRALDDYANAATSFAGDVHLAIGANPAGGSLSGTTTVTAVSSVATFPGLSIDRSGPGYTVRATSGSLAAATSVPFDIFPGPATRIAFSTQPATVTAGVAMTPAVRVTALDALGNTATTFTDSVDVVLATNPGNATLSGTRTVAAVSGVAAFADLRFDKAAAGYALAASAAGLTGASSASFTVTAAGATELIFTAQPVTTVAGAAITPAVRVSARDTYGNTATSFTSDVTVALATNPGTATLGGTRTVAAVAGVATFANLTVNRAGNGYSLGASASGLTGATSAGFDISAASATTLLITVQPSNATAGATISPAVQVVARDNFGNPATTYAGSITMALQNNPGSATLGGTRTIAAAGGVASFATLSVDKVGSGYTLAASASGLTGATSTGFNIAAGAATRLAFTVQPATTVAGVVISPSVRVAARDDYGNAVTSFSGNVTVALVSNPGSATLGGTKTRAASSGVATFNNLTLDKAATGYELAATAANLTGATSTSFTITAASAATLSFTVQPVTTAAGASITPAVRVGAWDSFGNPATGFSGSVTIALGNNPGSATLSGTRTVAAVAGIATFSTLALNRTGIGYTLTATATNLPAGTSAGFDVTPGPAAQLAFTTQPTSEAAGSPITPAVVVTVRDALGNTVTSFTGSVSMALGANPGAAVLSGTTAVPGLAGVATFADLRISRTGTGYTLVASSAGLTSATSTGFDVVAAIANRLVFTAQPSNATAGTALNPAVVVAARDSFGNTVTSFTGTVTMSVGANPGGATLSGTNPVTAVNGVATFTNLRLDKASAGYSLVATAGALTGATSGSFTIAPASTTGLAFTTQPVTSVAGAAITPAVRVSARDNFGNTTPSFTGNITVALGNNPVGATLSGTRTVAAVAGVATFSTLSLNKSSSGYTLTASASGLTGGTSAGFTIVAGSATTLAFTVQPSSEAVGVAIDPAVKVAARDNLGNTVATYTGSITVALQNNPTSATLSGTKTVSAVAGVATFSTLSLNKTGTGYTLRATASGLSAVTSSSFNITTSSGGGTVVLVGAGDIADCGSGGADLTANLLDGISGTVFTAGDNAYSDGSPTDFAQCYEPTWGRHKARTRPSPGNHDYHTSGAAEYYNYFGANAGPAGRGYYSYDLGDWHIVSLNSNVSMSAGSAQETWLRADLAASTKQCTLAYWHHPRFSSGSHGSSTSSQPLWQALYDYNADVVVVGHDHNYQRFAPMTPSGALDLARGIREFVAGMGGRSHYSFGSPIANTEAYNTTTYGVLKLTLSAGSYNWQFIPVAGGSFTDSGTGTCH